MGKVDQRIVGALEMASDTTGSARSRLRPILLAVASAAVLLLLALAPAA